MQRITGLCLAAALLFAALGSPVAAAEPREYAYLFVQGKLSQAGEGRPVVDARVLLTAGDDTHEARTDSRGFFRFERIPVAVYDLEVVTAEGEVIRRIREIDTANLDLSLLNVRVGKGSRNDGPTGIRVAGDGAEVAVTVPEPGARWGRFGKQLLIFLGAAGLLAL